MFLRLLFPTFYQKSLVSISFKMFSSLCCIYVLYIYIYIELWTWFFSISRTHSKHKIRTILIIKTIASSIAWWVIPLSPQIDMSGTCLDFCEHSELIRKQKETIVLSEVSWRLDEVFIWSSCNKNINIIESFIKD